MLRRTFFVLDVIFRVDDKRDAEKGHDRSHRKSDVKDLEAETDKQTQLAEVEDDPQERWPALRSRSEELDVELVQIPIGVSPDHGIEGNDDNSEQPDYVIACNHFSSPFVDILVFR